MSLLVCHSSLARAHEGKVGVHGLQDALGFRSSVAREKPFVGIPSLFRRVAPTLTIAQGDHIRCNRSWARRRGKRDPVVIGQGPEKAILIAADGAGMVPVLQHKSPLIVCKRVRQTMFTGHATCRRQPGNMRIGLTVATLTGQMLIPVRQIPAAKAGGKPLRMMQALSFRFFTPEQGIHRMLRTAQGIQTITVGLLPAFVRRKCTAWVQSAFGATARIAAIALFQGCRTVTCFSGFGLTPAFTAGINFVAMGFRIGASIRTTLVTIAQSVTLLSSPTLCRIFVRHGFPFITGHQRSERRSGDELRQVLQHLAARKDCNRKL